MQRTLQEQQLQLMKEMEETEMMMLMNFVASSVVAVLLFPGVLPQTKQTRNASQFEQRLQWDRYCKKHIEHGTFQR